jgi:hypothetical protein
MYIASFGLLFRLLHHPTLLQPSSRTTNTSISDFQSIIHPIDQPNQQQPLRHQLNNSNHNASNNSNPIQQQPSRATLLSSVISSVSDSYCQPRSLPAANRHQSSTVDSSSRQSHSSQCLPPASLLALARLPPGPCLHSPNESFVPTISLPR